MPSAPDTLRALPALLACAWLATTTLPAQTSTGHGGSQPNCQESGVDDEDCCGGQPLNPGFECCDGQQIPEDWQCCDGVPAPPGSTCCETNDGCADCESCVNFHCQKDDNGKNCCDGDPLPSGYKCCGGFAIPNDWVCCDANPAPPGSICCETNDDCPDKNCQECKNFYCQKTKTDGEPDCCDPCEAAQNEGDIDSDTFGFVACCNGQPFACSIRSQINSFFNNQKAAEIIEKCIKNHEENHFQDVDCSNNEGNRAGWRDDVDPDWAESRAYESEINCLTDSINDCNNDPDCITEILKRISDAEDILTEYSSITETLPP